MRGAQACNILLVILQLYDFLVLGSVGNVYFV